MAYDVRMWDARDLVERALEIHDDACPRCRLGSAKTWLDEEYRVPITLGDVTLMRVASLLPKITCDGWTAERSDDALRTLLQLKEL